MLRAEADSLPWTPIAPELSGARVGDYRLIRLLGRGGMADVWLAEWQTGAQRRPVALKRISPDLCRDPMVVRMFLAEARLAMRLIHPHIARALDAGELDGRPYIAFELVEGVNLRALWKAQRDTLPMGFALHVARALCAALAYAHQVTDAQGRWLGIVHRDVTPSNVMMSRRGAIKLVDFGIAKTLGQAHAEVTRCGVIKGKVGYLAPELLDGSGYDHRVDIFSLGVVLHELLTHGRLFGGRDEDEAFQRNRDCCIIPPSLLNPRVTRELDDITLRALARDPNDRYPRVEELDEALRRAQARWPWSHAQTVALMQDGTGSAPASEPSTVVLSSASEPSTQIYRADDGLTTGLAALLQDSAAKPPGRRRRVVVGVVAVALVMLCLAPAFSRRASDVPPAVIAAPAVVAGPAVITAPAVIAAPAAIAAPTVIAAPAVISPPATQPTRRAEERRAEECRRPPRPVAALQTAAAPAAHRRARPHAKPIVKPVATSVPMPPTPERPRTPVTLDAGNLFDPFTVEP
jgi:serine/threonine protein kinase